MKVMQVTIDERLLAALDADPEAKKDGRSAVVRRAVALYLRQRRDREIAEAYRRAYSKPPKRADVGPWAEDPVWPKE